MRKQLTPAQRLIVAADFMPEPPNGRNWAHGMIMDLAKKLKGTGVTVKLNADLRTWGSGVIDEIHSCSLNFFADLKLIDIGETLKRDGLYLSEYNPEMVTVMCVAGEAAMKTLKTALPRTEVLGVTVLTSLTDTDTIKMFIGTIQQGVLRFAKLAQEAGIDGLISSPKEAEILRGVIGDDMTLNTPGIRPNWTIVKKDDQNAKRVMTPADAIRAGADRIVVGRPIIQAANPYDAAMRTIDEIASACA